MYRTFFKPLLDFFIAFFAIVFLSPLLLLVTLLLAVANKGNPYFFQKRPGRNERIFKIVKFRTMTNDKDSEGNLLPDEVRLTGVGKLVRKSSIDEIPQLFNVFKGDMSLIGPRPLLPEYLPIYNSFQKQRHLVKPGITGWAQVNGRNTITWDKKFEYDIFYVRNVTFLLDIKIFYLTLKKVLSSADISAKDHISMPKFSGNLENNKL